VDEFSTIRSGDRIRERSEPEVIMRKRSLQLLLFAGAFGALAFLPRGAAAQAPDPGMKWGPAPAMFPAGAEMAVLDGDPGKTELFTIRLRLPDGYRLAPHTHPTDEHVTVIQGVFEVGLGSRFEPAAMVRLAAGGYITAPAQRAHFARARGATIVQVHAMGPFAMTYVNPADDPRATASR
jgi:quercetin dioxygenase-like cupin family protein